MITPLKEWIAELDLPVISKAVLHALADHSRASLSWPSNYRIRRWTGASERAVRSAIRDLEERSLITTDRNEGGPSRYLILFGPTRTPAPDAGVNGVSVSNLIDNDGGAPCRGTPAPPAAPPAPPAAPPAPPAAPPAPPAPELVTKLPMGTSLEGSAGAPPLAAATPSEGAPRKSNRRLFEPRGQRIPPDWKPNDEEDAYARSQGVDPQRVGENFRDYWISKAGKDARKTDWTATWKTWCRRDKDEGRNLISPNVLPFEPRATIQPSPAPVVGSSAWHKRRREQWLAKAQASPSKGPVIDGTAEPVEKLA